MSSYSKRGNVKSGRIRGIYRAWERKKQKVSFHNCCLWEAGPIDRAFEIISDEVFVELAKQDDDGSLKITRIITMRIAVYRCFVILYVCTYTHIYPVGDMSEKLTYR